VGQYHTLNAPAPPERTIQSVNGCFAAVGGENARFRLAPSSTELRDLPPRTSRFGTSDGIPAVRREAR